MDIARFDPARHDEAERLATRRECGLPERAPLLLNIGRIAKEKNLEQVMRVFPKLLNACPDVHFAIVGEGPMREDLGRMAEELGVSRAVTLTGPKPWRKSTAITRWATCFAARRTRRRRDSHMWRRWPPACASAR